MRQATTKAGTIVGIVNHDGAKDHPYGDVEFLGPLPDEIGVEWVGKSAKSLQEELDKDKPANPIAAKAEDFERARKALDEAEVPKRTDAEAAAIRGAMGSGNKSDPKPVEPEVPMTAARLLAADKRGDLKYYTFVKEAKRILGKDYPESEEKPAILKALEKMAGNPA